MKKQVSFLGHSLYYTDTGKGNAVMLVHGFGETGDAWKHQVDYLKNKYRLLVPDLPGSGKSPFIHNSDPSIDFYASALLQIQDEEEIEKLCIIGHSMGGYISLAFAEKFPLRINALGLFHSSSFADEEEKVNSRKKGITFIKKHGAKQFLESTIPNLFANPENPLKEMLIKEANHFTDEALINYYEAMISRPDRSRIIVALAVPFLMIIGEKDKAVPFETSLKQSGLAKLSFINILRNSGHMGMWEETEKTNQILAKFLEQI